MLMDIIFILYCGLLVFYWFMMKFHYKYMIKLYVNIKMKFLSFPFMSMF